MTLTALALLGLGACGDDDTSGTTNEPDATACADVFAAGRPTADVLADNDAGPCTDVNGGLLANVVVSWDCPDGTTVHEIQDFGWGRSGDVWQSADTPPPYLDCGLPPGPEVVVE